MVIPFASIELKSQEETGSTGLPVDSKRDKQMQGEWHVKLGDKAQQPVTSTSPGTTIARVSNRG